MNWEEEFVLKNRNLDFDYKLICNQMINITDKIKKYAKKHKVNLNICCIPGDYINISGNINICIRFIFNEKILIIKLNEDDIVFVNISIKNYFFYIEYINLPADIGEFNKKVYFLNTDTISEILKNILIFNNKL